MTSGGPWRSLPDRVRDTARWLRNVQRRDLAAFRAWLESTRNLLHLSVLLVVPLVIAAVTAVSTRVEAVSFLLYPPLAAGAYTLFADPASRYASPVRFVAGLTVGAACGVLALQLAVALGAPATGPSPLAAALSVFLTGGVTWLGNVEEPAAFSAALLAIVTGSSGPEYVVSIGVSSLLVAAAFVAWRRGVYEERARYLYQSVRADDRLLVPMRGPAPGATAMLAARLAAAHDAGKVVLLALVDAGDIESARRAAERAREERPAADLAAEAAVKGFDSLDAGSALLDGGASDATGPDDPVGPADPGGSDPDCDEHPGEGRSETRAARAFAAALEERAGTIERTFGVPCQVAVAAAGDDEATTVHRVAGETGCDLVATPLDADPERLLESAFLARLFGGGTDVIAHRSAEGADEWRRVLVPVRSGGDQAHAMIDFAVRIARHSDDGADVVTLLNCIGAERERRRAEELLATLSETVDIPVETAVARRPVDEYLARHGDSYDLVVIGASRDRSAASRLVSPPTSSRLDVEAIDADLAIVHRSRRSPRGRGG